MTDEKTNTGEGTEPAAGGEGQKDPVDAIKAIREELNEMKESGKAKDDQIQALQDQIDLYKANTNQGSQPSERQVNQATSQAKNFLDAMDDDDIPTNADIKQVLRQFAGAIAHEFGNVKMKSMPDNQDLTTKHYNNIIKENPELDQIVRSSPNSSFLKYFLGRSDPEYIKKQNEKNSEANKKKIEENAGKPASVDSVGAGKGGAVTKDWMTASKEEWEEHVRKVKSRV